MHLENLTYWLRELSEYSLESIFSALAQRSSPYLSDWLRVNANLNLTGQISDQFSCIHSGNFEAEEQFCFDIASDCHLIDMVPAPKCRRNRLYPILETGQFREFIGFQEPLLFGMKRSPRRNSDRGDAFVFLSATSTTLAR